MEAQLFYAVVHSVNHYKAEDPHSEEQQCQDQETRKQLGVDANSNPRDQIYEGPQWAAE